MACNNQKTKTEKYHDKNVESVLIINLPQTVNYRKNLMAKKNQSTLIIQKYICLIFKHFFLPSLILYIDKQTI